MSWDSTAGVALVLVGLGVAAFLGRADRRRALALAVPVLFYAPLSVFGPGLAFGAAAYGAAHGAQYYLMVGTVVRADRRIAGLTTVAVLVGGTALVVAATRFGYGHHAWVLGAAKGVVASHFVADAGLWRLRDPELRTFMAQRFGFLRTTRPAEALSVAS